MRHRWLTFLVMLSVSELPGWVGAATLNVPSTNYPTIQRAIYAAADGDTIQVAAGTYRENLVWDAKRLQFIGAGAELTIVDGDLTNDGKGDGSCLRMNNVPSGARVTGFTFRGGSAEYGGGIYCENSSPLVENNAVTGNSAYQSGGGICCIRSSPIIAENTISRNHVSRSHGGGLYCIDSSPVIRGNLITENTLNLWSGGGGGIACAKSAVTIEDNSITLNQGHGAGGGINCASSSVTIGRNTITGNNSRGGGAIYCRDNMQTVIRGNVITGNDGTEDKRIAGVANVAGGSGGGVYCEGGAVTIEENAISDNRAYTGGGIWCREAREPVVIRGNKVNQNTAQNGGGGILCGARFSAARILDNVVSGNTAGSMRNGGAIGGGIHCIGPATVAGNLISNNTAFIGGGAYSGASLIGTVTVAIVNNILVGNVASEGGGLMVGGDVQASILLSTFVGNRAQRGGGLAGSALRLALSSSIVTGSTMGGGIWIQRGSTTVSYCDVHGNVETNYLGIPDPTGINGNISEDPLFADPEGGDVHLKSTAGRWTAGGWVTDLVHSPCIDVGDPASDFSKEPAPNGGRINMGAYGNTDQASKSVSGQALTVPTPTMPAPTGEEPWTRPGTFAGQEIVGPAGIALVWVPGGSFMMGSTDADVQFAVENSSARREWLDHEQPVHRVELSGFWLGKTEVTVAQWRSVMGSVPNAIDQLGDDQPLVYVLWGAAQEFCERVGLELPTEAQWEYAARGPENRRYPWGNDWAPEKLCCGENQGSHGHLGGRRTSPVGSFPDGASWCGALDMAGNVWEWCADWYQGDYYRASPATDPSGPDSGAERIKRGGSWRDRYSLCRAAYRFPGYLDMTNDGDGFRVASCPTATVVQALRITSPTEGQHVGPRVEMYGVAPAGSVLRVWTEVRTQGSHELLRAVPGLVGHTVPADGNWHVSIFRAPHPVNVAGPVYYVIKATYEIGAQVSEPVSVTVYADDH